MTKTTNKPQNAQPTQRRRYTAPAIRDEEVFERLALQGNSGAQCTGEPTVCDRPGGGGVASTF